MLDPVETAQLGFLSARVWCGLKQIGWRQAPTGQRSYGSCWSTAQRLWQVVFGPPYGSGKSRHDAPDLKAQNIPLSTRLYPGDASRLLGRDRLSGYLGAARIAHADAPLSQLVPRLGPRSISGSPPRSDFARGRLIVAKESISTGQRRAKLV